MFSEVALGRVVRSQRDQAPVCERDFQWRAQIRKLLQLGASGGAMGTELFADLCTPNKISNSFRIIQIDVL
jgi:hypothetical protein